MKVDDGNVAFDCATEKETSWKTIALKMVAELLSGDEMLFQMYAKIQYGKSFACNSNGFANYFLMSRIMINLENDFNYTHFVALLDWPESHCTQCGAQHTEQ